MKPPRRTLARSALDDVAAQSNLDLTADEPAEIDRYAPAGADITGGPSGDA